MDPGMLLLDVLQKAPYAAYGVDLEQTIRFWNRSAERIVGHGARQMLGRSCHQVLHNLPEGSSQPVCTARCPSLRHVLEGRIPQVFQVRMLCASGQRKLVTVTPLFIAPLRANDLTLVHLFHESSDLQMPQHIAAAVEGAFPKVPTPGTGEQRPLTVREMEVLRLTALGLTPGEIAEGLGISYHTARNHISNIRRKLEAPTKLDLVRIGYNLGLI